MARIKGGLNAKTALDRSYQRSSPHQWTFLQQIHAWLETCKR